MIDMASNKRNFVSKLSKRYNVSNRFSYTVIALLFIILIETGVYAMTAGVPVIPVGHTLDQVSAPSGCTSNTFLKWTGSSWSCETPSTSPEVQPSTYKIYKSDGVTLLGDLISGDSCSNWVYKNSSGNNVQLTASDCATITTSDFYYVYNDCTFDNSHPIYVSSKTTVPNGFSYVRKSLTNEIYRTGSAAGTGSLLSKKVAFSTSCQSGNYNTVSVYDISSCFGGGGCFPTTELRCAGAPCILK